MRQDLVEILRGSKVDYDALDDLVWGRSDRRLTSLLKNPVSEGEEIATEDGEVVIDLTATRFRVICPIINSSGSGDRHTQCCFGYHCVFASLNAW